MDKLTEEDISNLRYFWQDKQDLERLCGFEKLIPKIKREFPELLEAWNNYKTSIRTLNAVVDSLTYTGIVCDNCGKHIASDEKAYPITNENFVVQKGLNQCIKCYGESI